MELKLASKLFKNKLAVLWTIFAITFLLRMYFSLNTDFTLDTYLTLNEAKTIMHTGFPLHEHNIVFPPALYYLMALFYKSDFLLKLINALLFSSITFLAYFLALDLSKNKNASLFSAAMASFLPAFFAKTISSITPYSLFIPLIFLFFLAFLKLKSEKYTYLAIALAFTLPRTSLAAVFIVPTLVLYLILIRLLNLHPEKKEAEMMLLSVFVIPWATFIFFKKPFEMYGLATIFGNVPHRIADTYFSTITLPEAITTLGFLPLLFGVFAIYSKVFNPNEREKSAYLLVSFVFVLAFSIWQKVMELEFALMMLGISLSILASFSFRDFISFVKQTKMSKEKELIVASFIFLLLLTLLIPSISYAYSQSRINNNEELAKSLSWLGENGRNASVMSSPKEGFAISYFSGKKPVLDNSFLLIQNSNAVYEDMFKIYTTPFETEALSLLNKHGIEYIIFDDAVRKEFGISEIRYVGDKSCFSEAYNNKDRLNPIIIYDVRCKLR